ncbi:hypothetical protein HP15_3230 [Marinobacter adhaerens HP15]|uniref:Uncharacterized protein n=1 Tax=Marinobacter adhaerens (strain DSM 23420 / HP15) TaxID=225937 RepID=E4PQC9_MARAH|nr:hypothetical protein HP15_3230 [Marinobacter adhaerens HP15]
MSLNQEIRQHSTFSDYKGTAKQGSLATIVLSTSELISHA